MINSLEYCCLVTALFVGVGTRGLNLVRAQFNRRKIPSESGGTA